MQADKEKRGPSSQRRRPPEDREISGRSTPRNNRVHTDRTRCGFAGDVRPEDSTTAVQVEVADCRSNGEQRRSHLPLPTVPAFNGEVRIARDSHHPPSTKRTNRLWTLEGFEVSSPIYTTSRRSLLPLTSKCRIPLPVATRRTVSSPERSKHLASLLAHSRSAATNKSINKRETGYSQTQSNESRSDACVNPDIRSEDREVPWSRKLGSSHACCGCAGTGKMAPRLPCSSSTKAKRMRGRLRRFDAQAAMQVSVAEESVEAGLQTASKLNFSLPRVNTFIGSDSSPESCRAERLDSSLHKTNVIDNDTADSRTSGIVSMSEDSLLNETGRYCATVATYQNDPRSNLNAPAESNDLSHASGKESVMKFVLPKLCQTSTSRNATRIDRKDTTLQLPTTFSTMGARRKRIAMSQTEDSISKSPGQEARKVAKNGSANSPSPTVKKTKMQTAEKPSVSRLVKFAGVVPSSSQAGKGSVERKRAKITKECRQNCKRTFDLLQSGSRTSPMRAWFVTLSGHHAPINFGFGVRRRSLPSVTFAKESRVKPTKKKTTSDHKLKVRLPWRDRIGSFHVPACHTDAEYCAAFDTETAQVNSDQAAEHTQNSTSIVAEQPPKNAPTTDECSLLKESIRQTFTPNTVATNSSDIPCASKDTDAGEQKSLTSANTDIPETDNIEVERVDSALGAKAAVPSFFIGIAPKPGFNFSQRLKKKPSSRDDTGHSLERQAASFISCSTPVCKDPRPGSSGRTQVAKKCSRHAVDYKRTLSDLSTTSGYRASTQVSSSRSCNISKNTKPTIPEDGGQLSASERSSKRADRQTSSRSGLSAQTHMINGAQMEQITDERSPFERSTFFVKDVQVDRSRGKLHDRKRQKDEAHSHSPTHKTETGTSTNSTSRTHSTGSSTAKVTNNSPRTTKRTPIHDSTVARKVNKTDCTSKVNSAREMHEIPSDLQREPGKGAVSFFVDFRQKPSRIPQSRRQNGLARSASYVVCTLREPLEPCEDVSSPEQYQTESSTVEKPSTVVWFSNELQILYDRDSAVNGDAMAASEISNNADTENTVANDIYATNNGECQNVEYQQPQAAENDDKSLYAKKGVNCPLCEPSMLSGNVVPAHLSEPLQSERFSGKESPGLICESPNIVEDFEGPEQQLKNVADGVNRSSCEPSLSSKRVTTPLAEAAQPESEEESTVLIRKISDRVDESEGPEQRLQDAGDDVYPPIWKSTPLISNSVATPSTARRHSGKQSSLLILESQKIGTECDIPEEQLENSHPSYAAILPRQLTTPVNRAEVASAQWAVHMRRLRKCTSYRTIKSAETTALEQLAVLPERAVEDERGDTFLKLSTIERKPASKALKQMSGVQPAECFDRISLDIGLTARVRNFDEVRIELPDIAWVRLHGGEIQQPKVVRLCQSVLEAVVLRNAVGPLPPCPQTQTTVDPISPFLAEAFPIQSLAVAQTRQHFIVEPATLAINVVSSRIDRAVQSRESDLQLQTAAQLSTKDAISSSSETRNEYICAKNYLDQQANSRSPADKTKQDERYSASGRAHKKTRHSRRHRQLVDFKEFQEKIKTNKIERKQLEDCEAEEKSKHKLRRTSFHVPDRQEIPVKIETLIGTDDRQPFTTTSGLDRETKLMVSGTDDVSFPVQSATRRAKKGDRLASAARKLGHSVVVDKERAAGEPFSQKHPDCKFATNYPQSLSHRIRRLLGEATSKTGSSNPPLESVEVDTEETPTFPKYIPVPYESLTSCRAPLIAHDQVDRSEWIRTQLAVNAERRRLLPGSAGHKLHRARSDPSLVSLGSAAEGSASMEDADDEEIDWTAVSPELEALCRSCKTARRHTIQETASEVTSAEQVIDAVDARRFDSYINEWHCRLNGYLLLLSPEQRPVFYADVYLEMPRRPVVLSVYNLKIELARAALTTFFEPCAQVTFCYVRSIYDKLVDKISSDAYEPLFTDFVCPAGYDALLTLSYDAGGLLRHSGTCCLRSLADVLEVDPDRLLVMHERCHYNETEPRATPTACLVNV